MRANTQHTMGQRVPADVDPVSRDELRRLAEVNGPCVSVFLPTTRFGPETLSGPTRLGHLVDRAAEELEAAGSSRSDASGILAPLRTLLHDDAFWQHQGEGLALFAGTEFFAAYRLAAPLSEDVTIGRHFRIGPLVRQLGSDGAFFILAISQNEVRLFRATKQTIRELDLRGIPGSMRDAIPQEEPARYGQSHSTGRVEQFHGQGSEADYDKAALERYFRALDRPLVSRLAGQGHPLVLACVGYYVPIYKAVSGYPAIWDQAVEGNPERRPLADLHDAAWALVADHFAEPARHQLDRYREAAGTGRTLSVPEEILAAAREGRIDTVLLGDGAPGPVNEQVEQALTETLRHDGQVLTVEDMAGLEGGVGALLRY
jgi:Bacterial archaeo-eukaryotic release factor family 3